MNRIYGFPFEGLGLGLPADPLLQALALYREERYGEASRVLQEAANRGEVEVLLPSPERRELTYAVEKAYGDFWVKLPQLPAEALLALEERSTEVDVMVAAPPEPDPRWLALAVVCPDLPPPRSAVFFAPAWVVEGPPQDPEELARVLRPRP